MIGDINPRPCPSCGHCPTCGRGGYYYGYWPYIHPWWATTTDPGYTTTFDSFNSGGVTVTTRMTSQGVSP